jgi:hypothetical protein
MYVICEIGIIATDLAEVNSLHNAHFYPQPLTII